MRFLRSTLTVEHRISRSKKVGRNVFAQLAYSFTHQSAAILSANGIQ